MSEAKQKLQTAFNETNPVVCDVGLGDLLFHYELGESGSIYVDGDLEEEDSFALQRQNSKVVYKVLVKDCKRLDDKPNWVEVEFNDVPQSGKYQLYFQPASKKQGEVGDDIFCEKVERLPVFHDFLDFAELANGYEDKYEEVIISEIYQDTSEEDTDISA